MALALPLSTDITRWRSHCAAGIVAAAGAGALATEMGSDDLSVGNGKTAEGDAASAVAALADRSPMAKRFFNVMTRPKMVKVASRWADISTGLEAGIVP